MNPQLVELGSALCAIVLVGWSVTSFINGTAYATGSVIREALAEALLSVRASSPMSRADLADASLILAVGLGAVGAVVERSIIFAMMVALLSFGRPQVVRSMSQENPMLAIGGSFTADLAIGVFVPLVLAQLLTHSYYLGAVLSLVIVSLSWPAGGGRSTSEAGGPWVPAWR